MPQISIGGQAVLEGVMMRSKDRLAIAVRKPSGEIIVETRPWFSLARWKALKLPFLRGFPLLLETLINGIKALNFSAKHALEEEEEELSSKALALTLVIAIFLALFLFVGLPHFFSLGMKHIGLGGGIDDLSFHLWDGLFRMLLFLGYVVSISFLPDIKRVFQYHGAEHKVIHTFEHKADLTFDNIKKYSRLHARCGTAFLLFVLCVSIILYAFLIPALALVYTPENVLLKHTFFVLFKIILVIPISGIGYEMIKVAGKLKSTFWCLFLCWPGLLLQIVTTKEPDQDQIEVAVMALNSALSKESGI